MPARILTVWGWVPISASRKTKMRPSEERKVIASEKPRQVLAKVTLIDGHYVVSEVMIEKGNGSYVEGLKIRGVRHSERDADEFARELMGANK